MDSTIVLNKYGFENVNYSFKLKIPVHPEY